MPMPELFEEKLFGKKGAAYQSVKTLHQRLSTLGTDIEKWFTGLVNQLQFPVKARLGVAFL